MVGVVRLSVAPSQTGLLLEAVGVTHPVHEPGTGWKPGSVLVSVPSTSQGT